MIIINLVDFIGNANSVSTNSTSQKSRISVGAAAAKGPMLSGSSAAANPAAGDHTQEELLRQLFPSWF